MTEKCILNSVREVDIIYLIVLYEICKRNFILFSVCVLLTQLLRAVNKIRELVCVSSTVDSWSGSKQTRFTSQM